MKKVQFKRKSPKQEAKTQANVLSEESQDILDKFIEYLSIQYVVDGTCNYDTLISVSTRKRLLKSVLREEFPKWRKKEKLHIPEDDYELFMNKLPKEIVKELPHVVGNSFKPDASSGRVFKDLHGDIVLNSYRPFHPEKPANYLSCKEKLDAYFDFLFRNNAQDKKIVKQFLAHIIQKPLSRPQYGVICRGQPGCGKSTYLQLVKAAFGGKHVYDHDQIGPVFQRFSSILPDNIIVAFDDVKKFPKDFEDQLKLTVTRTSYTVETKGEQALVEHSVYARMFALSNDRRPFLLSPECRRWYVTEFIEHSVDAETSKRYLQEFAAFYMDKDNWAGIYHYFKELDICDFDPIIRLETPARAELIALSTSCADSAIKEFLGGYSEDSEDAEGRLITVVREKKEVFHINALHKHFESVGLPLLLSDQIKLKLPEFGYESKRRVVSNLVNGGKQIDLWQPVGQTRSPPLSEAQKDEIKQDFNRNF
jgi:hypothetical protein